MKRKQIREIEYEKERYQKLADDYYRRGDYLAALRFAHRELREYGGDGELYARFADIYETMGLHGSAVNYWFKLMDVSDEEDFPDIYESLAADFLAMGNERAASYYYDRLIATDDLITDEDKMEILQAFSSDKREQFRFVYPPRLVRYERELSLGAKALKMGDSKRAIEALDSVMKGSKDYVSAREMQAVAYLLQGNVDEAQRICEELLTEQPDAVRLMATLAAVYLEQGKREESLALAKRLISIEVANPDDVYKVATVCCENGLHEEAYKRFSRLDEEMPYDGRMLYFKAVSAYHCGKVKEAERALTELCDVYPDAEVAKYYLRELRRYLQDLENEKNPAPPKLIYFYHLPQEEREERCRTLLKLGECSKDEAKMFGLLALHDGYFSWCFDEMDGGDRDLQYLGVITAAHICADEFLQDALLDYEVADVFKVEILRMLTERNEDIEVGVVLCNIYKRVSVYALSIGRKRRKKTVEGYAKVASKFAAVSSAYARALQRAAERLYACLERANALDLLDDTDDIACAIYFLSQIKDLGKDKAWIVSAFDANLAKVNVLLSYVLTDGEKREDKTNESH